MTRTSLLLMLPLLANCGTGSEPSSVANLGGAAKPPGPSETPPGSSSAQGSSEIHWPLPYYPAPAIPAPTSGNPSTPPAFSPTWTVTSAGPISALQTVWAASPADVWVGSPLMHFASGQFTSANVEGTITALAGTASDDVYAVGYTDGTPTNGVVYHFDGSNWSQRAKCATPYSVLALAANDLYVGTNGALLHSTDQGQSFEAVSISKGCAIEGVSGSGIEVAAVGTCYGGAKLFHSVDGGASFSAVALGSDSDDGFSVSSSGGSTYINSYSGLRQTSDGTNLSTIKTPYAYIAEGTISAVSASELWIADSEDGNGLLRTVDAGQTWTAQTGGVTSGIYGVFAMPHDVYGVGAFGILHGTF